MKTGGGFYYLAEVAYVDDDSYPDLIVVFEDNDTFLSKGLSIATLNGTLSDGTIISGKDDIYMVP